MTRLFLHPPEGHPYCQMKTTTLVLFSILVHFKRYRPPFHARQQGTKHECNVTLALLTGKDKLLNRALTTR